MIRTASAQRRADMEAEETALRDTLHKAEQAARVSGDWRDVDNLEQALWALERRDRPQHNPAPVGQHTRDHSGWGNRVNWNLGD